MNVLVHHLVRGARRSDPYVECRHCGTTLSTPTTCPACGSERTVTYDVD